MEHSGRHRIVWRFCRLIAALLVSLKFNFSAPVNNIPEPYLVLANHVTNWDPLMIGSAFKSQMYYVASEAVYRMGFASRLIAFFFSPIARQKGGNAAGTVKEILRTLKAGSNVCLFPEGNRSWDGCTADFPASTGKLVKLSGVSLVTYRLEGGYFSSPRWAGSSIRKGRVTGKLVGVYSPEELKTLSVDEINALIARDLQEDAYATQALCPVDYKGARLAEHMETLLFACPVCGGLHTLHSSGSRIACSSCGSSAIYQENGFLRGSFGFDTVRQWSDWQKGLLEGLCASARDELLFEDDELELTEIESGRRGRPLCRGSLRLFRDRLELPGRRVLLKDKIGGMSVFRDSVLFVGTKNGENYQLRSDKTVNVYKYLIACGYLGFIDKYI